MRLLAGNAMPAPGRDPRLAHSMPLRTPAPVARMNQTRSCFRLIAAASPCARLPAARNVGAATTARASPASRTRPTPPTPSPAADASPQPSARCVCPPGPAARASGSPRASPSAHALNAAVTAQADEAPRARPDQHSLRRSCQPPSRVGLGSVSDRRHPSRATRRSAVEGKVRLDLPPVWRPLESGACTN